MPATGENSPGQSPLGRGGRRDRGSRVYLRSQLLNTPLCVKENLEKKLNMILKELGIKEEMPPTAAVIRAYDFLRKEILVYLSLEKHIDKKEKEKKILS